MLCGLPPTFDPVLQQIKLHGSYTVHGNYFTCCKTNLSRAVKRASRKSGLVTKSRTTLYFLQQADLLQDSFDWWGVKGQHRYATRFAAMSPNKQHV